MITRMWHGKTKKEDADIYRQYIIDTGVQDYLKTDGNLDVQIWQKDDGEETHIRTVTRWKDIEVVKAFAGDDYEKARYYPEDGKYLCELEPEVKHYKTFVFSNNQMKNYIRQLEELYDGDNWTDETFMKKLGSLKKEKAFEQPVPGKHSVAEVLWHCIYWRKVLLKRMEGDFEFKKMTEKEQNFLPLEKLKEKGWDALLSEFNEINELLINCLKSKNDDFLEQEYTSGFNYRYLIEGIISHDFYHLGQIGFIISILNPDF
ncbi:MAG: DinB family protein [Ignavibacteria bacterium]|jgi:uncharacterized damage-inducible protein DinB/heme-degrading monooxygenase HmoA